jgi:hypothetical protein
MTDSSSIPSPRRLVSDANTLIVFTIRKSGMDQGKQCKTTRENIPIKNPFLAMSGSNAYYL